MMAVMQQCPMSMLSSERNGWGWLCPTSLSNVLVYQLCSVVNSSTYKSSMHQPRLWVLAGCSDWHSRLPECLGLVHAHNGCVLLRKLLPDWASDSASASCLPGWIMQWAYICLVLSRLKCFAELCILCHNVTGNWLMTYVTCIAEFFVGALPFTHHFL